MYKDKKEERIGEERYNKQGCLLKIIEYKDNKNIIVEFQDKYRGKVHTEYDNFKKGAVKNPYYPSVFGAGMIGNKYPSRKDNKNTKEYKAWQNMIKRCFDEKTKNENPTYKDVTCCDEWLLFENFYEWLHKQENFGRWYNGSKWCVDKDILVKGNKVYSPTTCCLVPHNVNMLFMKQNDRRSHFCIGVYKDKNKYVARCNNPFTNKCEHLGTYFTLEQTFIAYKEYKENLIKQVAQDEYNKGNITKLCYETMMKYQVEITD